MNRFLTTAALLVLLVPANAGFWDGQESKKANTEQEVPTLPKDPNAYGVDVSFPMHHNKVSNNYAWLPHNTGSASTTPRKYRDMAVQPLGDRQAAYDEFIQGCQAKWPKKASRCLSTEQDRIDMSLRQPQSMQNYTDAGFKKIKAPADLFQMIQAFWEKNKDAAKEEQWGIANTYTNNWKVPSKMVSVEDKALRGGGYSFKQKIWDSAKDIISGWTGQELTQCSLYGIRIYQEGAILAPHVDRLPLVSSAIINVAQDLEEPWPLEVIGHDGTATNVTMEPGDMVLYESHSVIHGRPYALKGKFMANIFIHFEPIGHSLRHNAESGGGDVHKKYRDDVANSKGGHEHEENDGLPVYIQKGSPEEKHWRRQHPNGMQTKTASFTTGSTTAHEAAKTGNVARLEKEIKKKKDSVHAKDENGWTPLHEGARGGHLEVVKLLVENGADYNHTTNNGGSVLWWAKQTHAADHPVIEFLEELGALDSGPEL